MAEYGTFSAVVDDAIARSGRPDRQADISSFARATIRELQCNPNDIPTFFSADFIEDQITANANPYIWTIPAELRRLMTVQYAILVEPNGTPIYPRNILPGRGHEDVRYRYYRSGDSYVFVNNGADTGSTAAINIAYYRYLPRLAYIAISSRPATYDIATGAWTYAATVGSDAASKAAARDLVTNWILFDHYDAVLEGILAKLYKVVADERTVSTFALYKSMQRTFIAAAGLSDAMGSEGG